MRRHLAGTAFVLCSVFVAACSSGSTKNPASAKPPTLRILVTNDDGYNAPGIDVVTEALRKLPDVAVTVVAPATNKSGTGSQATEGRLTATKRTTASRYPATAVNGFPSDTIRYALETLHLHPDVVVSGINAGQNLGPITEISGTVGAAKAAAARGLPAIAASQGLGNPTQYAVGATLVLSWLRVHRNALAAEGHSFSGPRGAHVVNLNIPSCAAGKLRGVKDVPIATDPTGATEPADCTSTVTNVLTDVMAFHNGFASVTELTDTGESVTSSTTFPAITP